MQEFKDMNKQQVWWKMHKSFMPPNNKWVIKIKCNSIYGAWLVAYGYSHVPGIDLSKS